jgi:formate-dependent nitrite reductase membrane component NrfD
VKQQNGPGLISILIVQTESGCDAATAPASATSLSDGAIAGIVIACGVVVAGVIVTAVLVSQKKKAKNRDRTMSTRLASASVSRNVVKMRQIR